jgi:hypothetical protein
VDRIEVEIEKLREQLRQNVICPGLAHAKPQPDITPFHFLTIDLY